MMKIMALHAHMRSSLVLFVAGSFIWSAFAIVASTFLIGVFVRINLLSGAGVPWFIVPALVVSFGVVKLSCRWFPVQSAAEKPTVRKAVLMCLAVTVMMFVITGLLMSGLPVKIDQLILPGDLEAAPLLFRNAKSLTLLVTAGLIEEAVIRGAVQLRLQKTVRPLWAELLAGIGFVLMHANRFGTPGELPFVIIMAVANGRLVAMTKTNRYASYSHALTNLFIGVVVLSARPAIS